MKRVNKARALVPITLGALAGIAGAQGGTFSVVAQTPTLSERFPVPGTFAVRRTDVAAAATVSIAFSGTARRNTDYSSSASTSVTFPAGVREVWVTVTPVRDRVREAAETIRLAFVGRPGSATITLADETAGIGDLEANRFLIQAAFGSDSATLTEVKQLGFSGWIDAQFTRPKSYLRPIIRGRIDAGIPQYHPATKQALWESVMKPLGGATAPDPLRQRVAYSLLQIFVISQNIDALSLNSEGVAHYYDRLMDGSFGNFRTLLKDVAMHPCMGRYLSHVGNRKADPSINRFPDENFAREIMQLFSIGLWELNQDGTQKLVGGLPIPTYNQETIRSYARVFTGLNYGGGEYFQWTGENFVLPMRPYDEFHDLAPKTLLSGISTPARTGSAGTGPSDTGVATMQDVDAAIDSLFLHPNVGPFIGKLLIQRLVTSNPTPAYVGRVAAAFANNGQGVRGDMRAVVKAILLDPEARDVAPTLGKTFGKKREPYLTLFNLAKTFDAAPSSGNFENATYLYDELRQEAFQSPSVFNFYLPGFRPSGAMTQGDVKGPEFQIMTAVTAHGALNLSYKMIYEDLSRWGGPPEMLIRIKPTELISLAGDPDALVARAALRLLDRPLRPRAFQAIREAVAKLPNANANDARQRVNMAVYLLIASPDFQIQK